jgi:hypothetical protein
MKAETIPGATRFLGVGNSGASYGLAIRDCPGASGNAMVSQWRPSPEELARLNAGMPVHLHILGTGHPAVAVEVPSGDVWRELVEEINETNARMTDGGLA